MQRVLLCGYSVWDFKSKEGEDLKGISFHLSEPVPVGSPSKHVGLRNPEKPPTGPADLLPCVSGIKQFPAWVECEFSSRGKIVAIKEATK